MTTTNTRLEDAKGLLDKLFQDIEEAFGPLTEHDLIQISQILDPRNHDWFQLVMRSNINPLEASEALLREVKVRLIRNQNPLMIEDLDKWLDWFMRREQWGKIPHLTRTILVTIDERIMIGKQILEADPTD